MEKSTIEKISKLTLMQGVSKVDILPIANQVWFYTTGMKKAKEIAYAVSAEFNTLISSDPVLDDDYCSYSIYPEGLIISVVCVLAKEEAPATNKGQEEFIHHEFSTFDAVEEEISVGRL
jgi:hypothetical protein